MQVSSESSSSPTPPCLDAEVGLGKGPHTRRPFRSVTTPLSLPLLSGTTRQLTKSCWQYWSVSSSSVTTSSAASSPSSLTIWRSRRIGSNLPNRLVNTCACGTPSPATTSTGNSQPVETTSSRTLFRVSMSSTRLRTLNSLLSQIRTIYTTTSLLLAIYRRQPSSQSQRSS